MQKELLMKPGFMKVAITGFRMILSLQFDALSVYLFVPGGLLKSAGCAPFPTGPFPVSISFISLLSAHLLPTGACILNPFPSMPFRLAY